MLFHCFTQTPIFSKTPQIKIPERFVVSPSNRFLPAVRLGANGFIVAGTATLTIYDYVQLAQQAAATEPYHDLYLNLAGEDPGFAEILSNNNSVGVNPGFTMNALAEHIEVEPEDMFTWLKDTYEDDPEYADTFVDFMLNEVPLEGSGEHVGDDPDADDGFLERMWDSFWTNEEAEEIGNPMRIDSLDSIVQWSEFNDRPLPEANP